MNNNCPSCGALYNVASKDIGRKLKCKKCSAALKVTDDGLELDTPTGSALPAESGKPAPDRRGEDLDDRDEEEPLVKKKRRADRGPGINPLALVGGIPTILFAFGVFLVILFIALPIIGRAGTDRANAYKDRLANEEEWEKFEAKPKKKQSEWSESESKKWQEDQTKIEEKYARLREVAKLEAESTRISNIRTRWLELYGLMFGFMFVAFGCIGYLRTEQPLVMKIVAGFILSVMMMIMFMLFGGCQMPRIG